MSSNWSGAAGGVQDTVAGYFANGNDAHLAIVELRDEGFQPGVIGAAFHSSGRQPSAAQGAAEATNDGPVRSTTRTDDSVAGAASGTGAVTPMGLSTGGGTVFAGGSAPGPITGSDIPADIPRTIPSEFDSESGTRRTTGAPAETINTSSRTTSSDIRETRAGTHQSWWDKLKHVFGSESTETTSRRRPVSDKESQNYGTGEGHLDLSSAPDYEYSASAFESSFSGMGIPPEHAQRLSGELRRGGAIVTVNAGSRSSEAAAILERNHGVVRYESASTAGNENWDTADQNAHVEVFGELRRVYPDYVRPDDVRARKAS